MGVSQRILETVGNVLAILENRVPNPCLTLATAILSSERIFVLGAGRSGLMAKAFAMRLMHLGLQVYIAGDCTTPSTQADDSLIIISSSGRTPSIHAICQRVSQIGTQCLLITAFSESPIQQLCSQTIQIPCGDYPEECGILPLGSTFELSALILLESTIAEIRTQLGVSHHDMKARHSILE